jgi:hypothetical protein
MTQYIRKRLLVLLALLTFAVVGVMVAHQTAADVNAQGPLDRELEPVIVKGYRVAALMAEPINRLYVYKFNGNTLGGRIPSQVDEMGPDGRYLSTGDGDGALDPQDEIVFMAKDLGDQPSDTSPLDSFATTWYEIEVVDPLSPDKRAWAYLVSRSPTSISGDYVRYNGASRRIIASQYDLGLADTYVGLNYLTLNGSSTDILDRSKMRVVYEFLGIPDDMTEDDLADTEITLIKDGRVRVILRHVATAAGGGTISDGSLTTTILAYASMLDTTTSVSVTLPTGFDITKVRTSVDFDSDASGANFHNSNTSGVLINGSGPDGVAATPFSNWAQVSHSDGRLIQVIDPTPAGGTPKNYYCDDTTSGSECDGTDKTGDGVSYGDTGTLIEGNLNESVTIESSFFILLPAGGSDPDNVGTIYRDYYFNPLIIAPFAQGERHSVFLPVILKNGQ